MAAAFDSTDEEDRLAQHEIQPLKVDKLELPHGLFAGRGSVFISGLPGCWFRNVHQDLRQDMHELKSLGITDAIILLTKNELRKYRAPSLFSMYEEYNILAHHHPWTDGTAPSLEFTITLLSKVVELLNASRSVLIHCMCGFGRTGVLGACLLQWMDDDLTPLSSVSLIRSIRSTRAIQTVAQYNFVMDFRECLHEERERSVSR
uniref:protein-tyrosine-phosphatase n=1 Tax=Hirondellea gigas TaxID=1518452 RepID=A0A2P2I0S5_9CRUS